MQAQRLLTDVPGPEVARIVADFESEGASIGQERQADGNWTIIATFRMPATKVPFFA